MSGSRLGRGRGGRLAVYGGCGVVVVLLVFLYRAATSEMARLRELNNQCAHQQEALAAQLQVIFEYKMRLEKSLAEEKSSNAAAKQELQQRASREKSLRDKDTIEAMQRFNSLQQTYKLLQSEHQDLQEECRKREKQALEDTNRLEATLRELRSRIRQAREDKDKALKHLKNNILELDQQKNQLEQKYNDILKSNGNTDSTMEHLRREIIELKRELEEAKKFSRKATSPGPSIASLQSKALQAKSGEPGSVVQLVDPSQQQQVSPPMNSDKNLRPLNAPAAQQTIEDPLQSNEQRMNDANNVRFAQKNGNIVPVGPNEMKEAEVLPLPYDLQKKHQNKQHDQLVIDGIQTDDGKIVEKNENRDEEQLKQVILPPDQDNGILGDGKSSSTSPRNEIFLQNNENFLNEGHTTLGSRASRLKQNEYLGLNDKKIELAIGKQTSEKVEEMLVKAQNNVDGILNQILRMI